MQIFSAGRHKYLLRDWKDPTKKSDGCCHSTFSVQSVKHMTTDQNSNNWLPGHQIWSKVQSTETNNLVRTKRKVRTVVRAIFKGEVAARALSPRINSGKASLSACGPAAKATNDANKCQDIWNQIYIVCILIYSMYIRPEYGVCIYICLSATHSLII